METYHLPSQTQSITIFAFCRYCQGGNSPQQIYNMLSFAIRWRLLASPNVSNNIHLLKCNWKLHFHNTNIIMMKNDMHVYISSNMESTSVYEKQKPTPTDIKVGVYGAYNIVYWGLYCIVYWAANLCFTK